MMQFVRVEKEGKIAYVSEDRQVLRMPTEESIHEKLIKLLEETKGDPQHPTLKKWWLERAKDCTDPNSMRAAWASELFELLSKVWDQLVVFDEPDVFSDFGL